MREDGDGKSGEERGGRGVGNKREGGGGRSGEVEERARVKGSRRGRLSDASFAPRIVQGTAVLAESCLHHLASADSSAKWIGCTECHLHAKAKTPHAPHRGVAAQISPPLPLSLVVPSIVGVASPRAFLPARAGRRLSCCVEPNPPRTHDWPREARETRQSHRYSRRARTQRKRHVLRKQHRRTRKEKRNGSKERAECEKEKESEQNVRKEKEQEQVGGKRKVGRRKRKRTGLEGFISRDGHLRRRRRLRLRLRLRRRRLRALLRVVGRRLRSV